MKYMITQIWIIVIALTCFYSLVKGLESDEYQEFGSLKMYEKTSEQFVVSIISLIGEIIAFVIIEIVT